MAGSLQASPTFALQPSAQQVATSTNYITDFDFLNQYLPDTYEKEFERYGDRSVTSFLRMVSAEIPSASDQIKWEEQGRLHTKYTQVGTTASAADDTAEFQVNDTLNPDRSAIGLTAGAIAVRVGQTVHIVQNDGSGSNKGIVTVVDTAQPSFTVAFYEAGGLVTSGTGFANSDVTVYIYGSEFAKGTNGMSGSLEADPNIFENNPIILKDNYKVNGSDMAQIGWVETDEGYLWFMKSEHETRMRFDDYLETAMIEDVPAATGGGAKAAGFNGMEGVFYVVGNRGNVWAGGNPTALSDWDSIIQRLDKQGSIQENALFCERDLSFSIDDMLAAQNSYGAGGTSYGLFDNDENMALSLGFSGFRRGSYEFYKTDWKYLNDPTMRGGLPSGSGSGKINGLLVPAGTTTVYDKILGKNAKRPFLHVRYRKSEAEDRKYKTWITGGAGGAATTDEDAMRVNFLSERSICTMGANNFFLFQE